MSTKFSHRTPVAPTQRGFTLVELMVTVGIALFLLGGLVSIMQNVRQANLTQSTLTALQDQERFALTVMTDAIQVGGYLANPVTQSSTDFSSLAVPLGVIPQNSAFFGGHTVGAPDNQAADTIYTRFDTLPASNTTIGTGPILCNGTDTSVQPGATYTIAFTVSGGALQCSVDGGNTWVPIVPGVQALAVYYGINRNAPGADYNIDTYVTADMMQNPGDWLTVSAVRIVLSFANPMWVAGGTQPQYITVERVVQVMGRAGVVI